MSFCVIAFTAHAHAGAWTPEAKHGQIIVTASYYQTSTAFDNQGRIQPFGYGGRFRQVLVSSYLEYGLTKRNTVLFNASLPFLDFRNFYGKQSSAGFGDMEAGLRRRLSSSESRWALSAQVTGLFPAYSETRSPAPGNHQFDLETRLLLGRGSSSIKRHVFWDVQGAYRYRHGPPADQVRADGTIGIDLSRRVMVMGQVFVIKSLRNGDALRPNSNPNAQSDFDLYKYQPSAVFRLGRTTRLQCGWNHAFSGRNTGQGHTAVIALWKDF